MSVDGIRFTDVLTTGSAIANYLGVNEVTAAHLLDAIEILNKSKTMDDLGRAVSPLVPRPRSGASAAPEVRDLAQRWFAALESNPLAELDAKSLGRLRSELSELSELTPGG